MIPTQDVLKAVNLFLQDLQKPPCEKCGVGFQEFKVDGKKVCWRCVPKGKKVKL